MNGQEEAISMLSGLFALEPIEVEPLQIDADALNSLPQHLMERYRCVPLRVEGDRIVVAMAEPDNALALDDIRLISGYEVRPVLASASLMHALLEGYLNHFQPSPAPVIPCQFPLQSARVSACLSGPCAWVEVEQRFLNPLDTPLQCVYSFPMPADSVLQSFKLRVGNRVLEGKVAPRRQTDKPHDNLFQVRLGDISPHQEVTVELSYAQRLEVNGNEVCFRLAAHPAQAVTVDMETSGAQVTHLVCSHDAEVQYEYRPQVVRVLLARDNGSVGRDFVLRYRLNGATSLLTHGEHFLLSALPPLEHALTRGRHIAFLLDCSGSMRGMKLDSLKRAVSNFLGNLEPADRFTLTAFDERHGSFRNGQECGRDDVGEALAWIESLQPGGATHLLSALQLVNEMLPKDGDACVIVITDGQVGNESLICRALTDSGMNARLFTIGLDSAVNHAFLRQLSRLGRGSCQLISPQQLDDALLRLQQETRSPLPTFVLGHVSDNGQLEGAMASRNAALSVLWARERISMLEDRLRLALDNDREAMEKTIMELALRYRLVTSLTCFELLECGQTLDFVQPAATPNTAAVEETVQHLRALDRGVQPSDEEDNIPIPSAKLGELVDEAPIVRVANLILSQAITDRASHVHIDPERKEVRVRFRVDGVLHDVMTPPKHIQELLVGQLKKRAGLNLAVRDQVQNGSFKVRLEEKEFQVRLSVCPTVHGEKALVEISGEPLTMQALGLGNNAQQAIQQMLGHHQGLILLSGPARCGLSTTLHAMLACMPLAERNAAALLQRPIHPLSGISHVPLSCANALNSPIGQEADVIATDCPIDSAWANRLVNSAFSGRLVLAAVHANNAAEAIHRLLDMGVEPHLLAGCLSGVLSQRLVRSLCARCKRRQGSSYSAPGCDHCKATGYSGRTALFELLIPSARMRGLLLRKAAAEEIRACLRQEGFRSMWDEAQRLVLAGSTSPAELARAAVVHF